MKKEKFIIGAERGIDYKLRYRTYAAEGHATDPKHQNTWRWFLEIDGEYAGDFGSRSKAIDHIRHYQ